MYRFETARLIVSPFEKGEEPQLHKLFIDPYIRKYLWDDEVLTFQQSDEVLKQSIAHFETDQWGLWKIQIKESPGIIGFVGLWFFFEESQPQLLYGLLEKFSGKGYASEAAKTIANYSFEHLSFPYLLAAMDEEHSASQQLAKRIGMSFIEIKEENGKDTVFYKIEKE